MAYGSLLMRPGDANGVQLPNGGDFFLMPVNAPDMEGIDLPAGVSLAHGCIVLTVPTRISVLMIDQALHRMLKPRSLLRYLDSTAGQQRLREAGYDPACRLHSSYSLMTPENRISLAHELYILKQRRELGTFVKALGALIAGM